MKKIFTLLMLFPFFAKCQNNSDSIWKFTKVVNVDSTTKLQLFGRANEWFSKHTYYKKSKSFVSENETGKLTSEVLVGTSGDGDSYCKISFIAKDNKYKIELSDFFNVIWGALNQEQSDRYMGFRAPKKRWEKLKSDAFKGAQANIELFTEYMSGLKREQDF